MLKTLRYLLLTATFFFALKTNAQPWQPVGPVDKNWPIPANVHGNEADMAVAPNGTPYAVFRSQLFANNKITVRAYNGTGWETVGTDTFTVGFKPKIAIDNGGVPYVLYYYSNKLYVIKYTAGSWTNVGGPILGISSVDDRQLAIDPATGIPYVMIWNTSSGSTPAYVMKFDGTGWVAVGSTITGTINPDITFSSSGVPYLVYSDVYEGMKLTVRRFDGSNWVLVGTAGFSAIQTGDNDIMLDNNDMPYVACREVNNSYKVFVYKFSGGSWTTVGTPQGVVGPANPSDPYIDFNTSNVPYLSYSDGSFDVILKKFDGAAWVDETPVLEFSLQASRTVMAANPTGGIYNLSYETEVGTFEGYTLRKYYNNTTTILGHTGISKRSISSGKLACDKNGTPYFMYPDRDSSNRLSVKKYDGANWVYVGTQYITSTSASGMLAVSDGGELFAMYNTSNDSVVVKKYNGSNWVNLGNYVSLVPVAGTARLVLDRNAVPYVVHAETNGRPTVRKFDGTNWVLLGTVGFYNSYVAHKLTFDKNNVPYLMTWENNRATVLQFDGNAWNVVGTPMFSTYTIDPAFDIEPDTGGVIHIAYADGFSTPELKVKKWVGSQWVAVGDTNFSSSPPDEYVELKFDAANVPYIGVDDYSFSIYRFKGVSWVSVPMNAGFMPGESYAFDLAKDAGKLFYFADVRGGFVYVNDFTDFCTEPDSAWVHPIGQHQVTLNIKPVATVSSYDFQMYGPVTLPVVNSNTPDLIVNGLKYNWPYIARARTRCSGDSSSWVYLPFKTADTCKPAADTVKNVTEQSVDLAWNERPGAVYEYAVLTSTTPPSSGTITPDTVAAVGGLQPNTQYYVHFRTICSIDTLAWQQQTFTTKPVSVKDINRQGVFLRVYPNPATNNISIHIGGIKDVQGMLSIADITGKLILQQSVTDDETVLNISSLVKGTYILKYKVQGYQQVIKLVKE